jgi:hypothetical protein
VTTTIAVAKYRKRVYWERVPFYEDYTGMAVFTFLNTVPLTNNSFEFGHREIFSTNGLGGARLLWEDP